MEELGKDVLYKLIEFIETASPKLWHIAIRQAYTDAAMYALGAIAMAVIMAIVFAIWRKADAEELSRDNAKMAAYLEKDWAIEPGYSRATNLAILAACEVTLAIPLVPFLVAVASRLINPEYYAILVLIELLGVR